MGAGSKDFGRDGRKENGGWGKGAPGLRPKGWRDVGLMVGQGSQAESEAREREKLKRKREDPETLLLADGGGGDSGDGEPTKKPEHEEGEKKGGIFSGLCIYINGSTAPAIGDHKLKHLLAQHGAQVSIALARRTVTHVIVGKPNNAGRGGGGSGAGGGLAGSKIEKEIRRVRGNGVKFVSVDWAVESVRAGRRLAEAGFQGVSVAPKGVGSVYGLFEKRKKGVGGDGVVEAEKGKEGVVTGVGDGG